MDILKMLGGNSSDFVSGLIEKAGFNRDQAEKFVPEAASSVVDAAKNAGDLDFSNLAQAAQSITSKVDVAGLARKTGVDTQLASSGLSALVPQLLRMLQDKAGGAQGIGSLLAGLKEGGLGGLLGGAGKLFGK